ncbi:MAG TPA: DUF4345 domain-containing protein [Tardiphaga sp.]
MQRRLLQTAIALTGLSTVGFGLAGVLIGTGFTDHAGDVTMDSYVRFLKGMLLAIGLIYWSAIPDIEKHGERIALVTFILVLGAIPRLMSVISHGVPTLGILLSLFGELVVVPLIWLWQRHVARLGLAR